MAQHVLDIFVEISQREANGTLTSKAKILFNTFAISKNDANSFYQNFRISSLFYTPNDKQLFDVETGMRSPKFFRVYGSPRTGVQGDAQLQIFFGSGTPFRKNASGASALERSEVVCLSRHRVRCFFDGEFTYPNKIDLKHAPQPWYLHSIRVDYTQATISEQNPFNVIIPLDLPTGQDQPGMRWFLAGLDSGGKVTKLIHLENSALPASQSPYNRDLVDSSAPIYAKAVLKAPAQLKKDQKRNQEVEANYNFKPSLFPL
jgi:hypothetical protein